MKNNDERIALDIQIWAGEDVRAGMARFQRSNFEQRLRKRLAPETNRPPRRRWLPISVYGAVLAAVIGTVIYLHQPAPQLPSGREAIAAFFSEHSTLGRLQEAPGAVTEKAPALRVPIADDVRLSRTEMTELFQHTLPWRDLSAGSAGETEAPHDAPRELKQTIDRFFSITLKSIKEKI